MLTPHVKPGVTTEELDRICRENGITHRLTKPRSPTTTGKVERFHQTLHRELRNRGAQLRRGRADVSGTYHCHFPTQLALPASR